MWVCASCGSVVLPPHTKHEDSRQNIKPGIVAATGGWAFDAQTSPALFVHVEVQGAEGPGTLCRDCLLRIVNNPMNWK